MSGLLIFVPDNSIGCHSGDHIDNHILMRKRVLIIVLTAFVALGYGQEVNKTGSTDLELLFSQQIDKNEFKGAFSLFYTSVGEYDYYVVDMTVFADSFSRTYFVNLTYKEDLIIPMNIAPAKEQNWFKVFHKYENEEIKAVLDDLKDKTIVQAGGMTAEEKTAWMNKNNKFKN